MFVVVVARRTSELAWQAMIVQHNVVYQVTQEVEKIIQSGRPPPVRVTNHFSDVLHTSSCAGVAPAQPVTCRRLQLGTNNLPSWAPLITFPHKHMRYAANAVVFRRIYLAHFGVTFLVKPFSITGLLTVFITRQPTRSRGFRERSSRKKETAHAG